MTLTAQSPLPELSRAAGLDLAAYRPEHVRRRLARAMADAGVADEGALARLAAVSPQARARLRRAIAMPVTRPFRDPHQFELLERELLPPLVARGGPIRAWSAGCADGCEPYSLAVVLDRLGALGRATVLASDLLDEHLDAARCGDFGWVPGLERVRERVRFEQRSLPTDGAPPGRFDLILCRNLAIYLTPAAKAALRALLAGALARGGVLLLGRSERLPDPGALGLERAAGNAYRRAA